MNARVLIAKVGLDGHDRGAKVVARRLRDAGFEVIYTGIRKTPQQVVDAAIQEDVDAIGLSSLSGGHMTVFPEVLEELEKRDRSDVLVFAGGVIPEDDQEELKQMGIKEIFGPGTDLDRIVEYLNDEITDENSTQGVSTG